MARGILGGVLIAVLFSFWPLRAVNLMCCIGIVGAGAFGAIMAGRADEQRIDPAEGLKVGAIIGMIAAVVVLVINILLVLMGLELPGPQGLAGPVPLSFAAFLQATWEAIQHVYSSTRIDAVYDASLVGRFFIDLFSNLLFGGVGGALGATLFQRGVAPASSGRTNQGR